MVAKPTRKGTITTLVDAVRSLGLDPEVTLAGRWVRFQGERCPVYVIEAEAGGYYTWCDDPRERAVEFYHDPDAAIVAGQRRARGREEEEPGINEP